MQPRRAILQACTACWLAVWSSALRRSVLPLRQCARPPAATRRVSMEIPYLDGFPDVYDQQRRRYSVVFIRHGESQWNRPPPRFIGWRDIPLTSTGVQEAARCAKTLTEFQVDIDVVFCSYLKRSIKTAWTVADTLGKPWVPVVPDWRLNEQMYGGLEGWEKRDMVARHGVETVQRWRRSYDTAPPPRQEEEGGRGYFPEGDRKYATFTDENDAPGSWCGSPGTESLKDAQTRVWAMWKESVVPRIRAGESVLVCGHGNVIRALLKRLDGIPAALLKEISIPRATPLVYDLDDACKPVRSAYSLGPLSGRFLGNPLELARAMRLESPQAQLGSADILPPPSVRGGNGGANSAIGGSSSSSSSIATGAVGSGGSGGDLLLQ